MKTVGFIVDLSLEFEDISDLDVCEKIGKISEKGDIVFLVEKSSAAKVVVDTNYRRNSIVLECSSPFSAQPDEHRMTFYSNIYDNCDEIYIITSIQNEAIEHWISNYVEDDTKVFTTYLR